MLESARHAPVLYNPEDDLEAMHAALFARDGVTRFRCRHMGRDLASTLDDMYILDDILGLAVAGDLDLVQFARLYRRRRHYGPYLRALLEETEDHDRPKLTAWLAGSVLPRKNMPRMRRALERLSETAAKPSAAE